MHDFMFFKTHLIFLVLFIVKSPFVGQHHYMGHLYFQCGSIEFPIQSVFLSNIK
jgi:hypothetical protein